MIRGHNYLYTDYLMTIYYSKEESLAAVIKYFELNIKFVANYLKEYDSEFKLYYQAQYQVDYSHLNNA